MLGIRSGDCTNIHKSSGNQIAWASMGQWGSVLTGPVGPSRAPVVTELVVGMRMPTVHSSSLTEHLLPWLMGLEQRDTNSRSL